MPDRRTPDRGLKSWLPARRDVISFAGVFVLLGAVYLLPPDTSLREVRAAGALRVCLPPSYPPLVTGDPAAPGLDVELLRAIADDLGVRLEIVTNAAMGADFNPRAWRITRAQCDMIGGGVANSTITRSFLATTPPYTATGWAWLAPRPDPELRGQRVGILVSASGLDRVALAAWLRAAKARVTIVASGKELIDGLKDGRFDAGITERLLAAVLAAPGGFAMGWMPPVLVRYDLVFGLWKGDLTLKRAIVASMERLRRGGDMARIEARYVPAGSIAQNDARQGCLGRSK
jgi:polar amino acid transport system substrate-binding protein/cystine transport system substrate-binding protein/membrane-bound lytic murein transglycosylase F